MAIARRPPSRLETAQQHEELVQLGALLAHLAVVARGREAVQESRSGDSTLIHPMMGHKGPKGYGGSPAFLWLYVDNSDAWFKRAVDAGAKVQMELADQFWGDRAGSVSDPAGYSWWIATRKEELTSGEIHQRALEAFKQMEPATR